MKNFIYIWIALLVIFAVGCGGGGSTINTDVPDSDPFAGIESVMVDKGGIEDPGHTTSDLVFPFMDPTPEDYCWDLIFGQTMFWGTACLVNDGNGNWSMEFSLDEDMVEATGWVDGTYNYGYQGTGSFYGFCDLAVDWSDEADIGSKAGKYQAKFDYEGVLSDIKTDWSMPLVGFDPAEHTYIAIHTTVCKGTWVDGEFDDEGDETGWGGFYNWKGEDGEGYWEFRNNWRRSWGGYNELGSMFGYPYAQYGNGDTATFKGFRWLSGSTRESYWDINFTTFPANGLPPGHWMWNTQKIYRGWCADNIHAMGTNRNFDVKVYSTYDPNLTDHCAPPHPDNHLPILHNGNWDYINFMVNQRNNPDAGGPWAGAWGNTQRDSMEVAIWYFTNNIPPTYNGGGTGARNTALVIAMIDYAIANGDNFVPKAGDWYAMVMMPDPENCAHGTSIRAQMNIIEVDP